MTYERSETARPRPSLSETPYNADDGQRLLTEAGMQTIYTRLQNLAQDGGKLEVHIEAWWRGSLRWARNRVSLASEQRDVKISILREKPGSRGYVSINQIDDTSLATAMREAERRVDMPGTGFYLPFHGVQYPDMPLPYPDTAIWSDVTYQVTSAQRAQLAQTLTVGAEDKQFLSAGYLEMSAHEAHRFGNRLGLVSSVPGDENEWRPSNEPPHGQGATRTTRDEGYVQYTEAQCSMTVRHPKGLGSGWAGLSSYDWSAINGPVLAQRALEKCIASVDPVAIEPGRYTVIMEPQAVLVFASGLVGALQLRASQEQSRSMGVFSDDFDPTLKMRMTKLGQLVVDERITISHDPMDPQLGILPKRGLRSVTWIDKGRLVNMGYEREEYSLSTLHENMPVLARSSFTMTGGTTTIEEMIATTKRGVVVTRFSGVTRILSAGLSLLCSGVTRDGLWLVENGKITKAIKNMRFTDSPLYVFNQLEQIGAPVPVFTTYPGSNGLSPALVPPIKSVDFAFTATIDAI